MSFTIHKNVKVLSVRQQQQTYQRRTKDIVDPIRERGSYHVTVASFENVAYEATIAEFKKEIKPNQYVSVAINDKNQVIAVVNHTTGAAASLAGNGMNFGELGSIAFYLAIPSVLLYFIAKKAFSTVKYHDLGWVFIGIGVLIIILVLRGIGAEIRQSKNALSQLR